MTCRLVQKKISLYFDDRLPAAERAEIDLHLKQCSTCSEELAVLRESLGALAVLERIEPREGGWERLRDKLEKQAAPHVKQRWFAWPRLAAGAAVAAIVLMTISLWNTPSSNLKVSRPVLPMNGQPDSAKVALNPPGDGAYGHAPALPDTPVLGRDNRRRTKPFKIHNGSNIRQRTIASGKVIDAQSRLAALQREPDPESGSFVVADKPETMTDDVAGMVSAGLAPLVTAAAQVDEDPMDWLSDINTEDWL